jgi:beta-phosphoglucomutase-like phosphatase (HAD superfamily)
MVARGKPAPDLFLYAADRMNSAPERCVVVEDSREGVRAAVAAGMRVLGFAGGSHCALGHDALLRAAGASLVFSRMARLPRLLESAALA